MEEPRLGTTRPNICRVLFREWAGFGTHLSLVAEQVPVSLDLPERQQWDTYQTLGYFPSSSNRQCSRNEELTKEREPTQSLHLHSHPYNILPAPPIPLPILSTQTVSPRFGPKQQCVDFWERKVKVLQIPEKLQTLEQSNTHREGSPYMIACVSDHATSMSVVVWRKRTDGHTQAQC